jgi:phenylacetate-CoA ligase
VLTDDGVVELRDGDDGAYELVGTTLNNPAMSLRRYRTGDRVLPRNAPRVPEAACFRPYKP